MSKIEWTGETWNPVIGCDKVSPGCKNCYAIRTAWIRLHNPKINERYTGTVEKTAAGNINWTGKINMLEEVLMKPLKTKKPTVFFVNSMSDLFHEQVPFDFIDKVFAVMALCPQHTFQVLTKRAERMYQYFDSLKTERCPNIHLASNKSHGGYMMVRLHEDELPLPNVWLGVSVENNDAARDRIIYLASVPSAVRFLSCEPLLGPVNLWPWLELTHNKWTGKPGSIIDWVICGGESGPGARPMHPDWARSLRDHCKRSGVPFFFKQWGEYSPGLVPGNGDEPAYFKVGKKVAGRLLDGILHDEYPKQVNNA